MTEIKKLKSITNFGKESGSFNESLLSCNAEVNEDIEKHDTLNPKLFDENNKLKPEVHDKILEIVDEFIKGLEEDGIKIDIDDIKIVGSNCSYNYTKDSDLDLHIVANTDTLECPDDLYPLLYSAYRSIFNSKYDIDFYGIPVEIFVETSDMQDVSDIDTDTEPMGESLKEARQDQALKSNGVYSVLNDKWIKEPIQTDIPDIDYDAFEEQFKVWEDRYFDLINNETLSNEEKISEIENLIEDIYELRKDGLARDGEYSIENLTFKEFRNLGYLDNLKDLKNELKSRELSLEGLEESMKGKVAISDNKILGFIDECVNEMKKLKFSNDDSSLTYDNIDIKEGTALRTFGTMSLPNADGGNFTLTLNKHMYEEPEESIKNTIYHELCHYVTDSLGIDSGAIFSSNGRWYGNRAKGYNDYKSHGRMWKKVANIVSNATNQQITRTNDFEMHKGVGQQFEDSIKYIVKCKKCGQENKRTKSSEFVRHPEKWRCGICGANDWEVIDNTKK